MPWWRMTIALGLGFFVPGLGQFCLGRRRLAYVYLGAAAAAFLGAAIAIRTDSGETATFFLVMFGLIWATTLVDLIVRVHRLRPRTAILAKKESAGEKCVFIVHGANHRIRDQVDLFLSKELNLDAVVMESGAHSGRTLPEKFEEIAKHCSFAVFIVSGDDELTCKGAAPQGVLRARQNVILEIGYFWGALGRRGRMALLVERDVELPSDLQGLGWIEITPDLAQTKLGLRKELEAAGLI